MRHYKFDVEYMIRKPDCLEHVVMGINGQFPGPTIRAEVGDILDIALTNKLFTEGSQIRKPAVGGRFVRKSSRFWDLLLGISDRQCKRIHWNIPLDGT